jgi:hypothetical protein
MSYAINPAGTQAVATTVRTSGTELRNCGTTFAYAAGLASRGIAGDHVALQGALRDFATTYLAVVEALADASSALGRDLTWAALSAHEVEVAVAADLGAAGAMPPCDSAGVRV